MQRGTILLEKLLRRPIAFHPIFAEVAGSMNAGIMLSQAYYWTQVLRDSNPQRQGWFYKTRDEWAQETHLTRYEQDGARVILRKSGFWNEVRKDVPAKMWYRIDLPKLENAIQKAIQESSQMVENQPTSWGKTSQQDGGKTPNKMVEKPPSITESTPESTHKVPQVAGKNRPATIDSQPTSETLPDNPPSEEELTLLETINLPRKFDKRFQPLLSHYGKWNRQLGFPVVTQRRDENRLRQFLKDNRTLILPVLMTTMDNAFKSINNPFGKLKPGFTIGDWIYHYAKYSQGPVLEKKGKTENQKLAEKNNWIYNHDDDSVIRARPVPGMKYVREGSIMRLVPDNGK